MEKPRGRMRKPTVLLEAPVAAGAGISPGPNRCREEELRAPGERGLHRTPLDRSCAVRWKDAARPKTGNWQINPQTLHSSLPHL